MAWWRNLIGLLAIFLGLWLMLALPAHAASLNNRAQEQVVLSAPIEKAFPAAAHAFEIWKRGELVNVDESKGQVRGLSRTNLFKFVDDITVSLQPGSDPGQTQLDITSIGRMGEYDFGGNRRNINEYLTTLRTLLAEAQN